MPKNFRQRYTVFFLILVIGWALISYHRYTEQQHQDTILTDKTQLLMQYHLDQMANSLTNAQSSAQKLSTLINDILPEFSDNLSSHIASKPSISIRHLISLFNQNEAVFNFQYSIENSLVISKNKTLAPKTQTEWRNQGFENIIEARIPLKQKNAFLKLTINIDALKNTLQKPNQLGFYINPLPALKITNQPNEKINQLQYKKVDFFDTKIFLQVFTSTSTYGYPFITLFYIIELIICSGIAAVIHLLLLREDSIRKFVRYKTKELAAANASLAKEIAAHRSAARKMIDIENQLRAITDAIPIAIFQLSINNTCKFINKTALQWTRQEPLSENDLGKLDWLSIFPIEGKKAINNILSQVSHAESATMITEKMLFSDGIERYLKIQAIPKRDNKYTHVGTYLIIIDISDQILVQKYLSQSNENHILLSHLGQTALSIEHIDQLFIQTTQQLHSALNSSLVYLAQYKEEYQTKYEIIASSDEKLISTPFPKAIPSTIKNILLYDIAEQPYIILDTPLISVDDSNETNKPCYHLFLPIFIFKKHYAFLAVQQQDDTPFESHQLYLIKAAADIIVQAIIKHKTEATLFNEKERAEVTLASITDAVVTTNESGKIEFINSSAEKMLGWNREEVLGEPIHRIMRILNEGSHEYIKSPLVTCLETGNIVIGNEKLVLYNRYGHERAIDCSAAPLHNRAGDIMGGVLIFRDVTSQRQLSHQLSHQATHDALTGLINRFEFERRLNGILNIPHETSEENHENALLYLDLDQFKVVNDTCGHAAGDALLRQLSSLLLQRLRKRDTLARLGGDEFTVLLEHCPPIQAERIANELRQTVRDFRFSWEGKIFRVGVSIGLINFGTQVASISQLLSAADTACYLAKESGRDRIQISRLNDTPLFEAHQQMNWVARLQHALEENRFKLFAQEIRPLSARPNEPIHYEILIRLLDESQNIILPGAFIPAAERYNLMTQIDKWVIQESLVWLAQYTKTHPLNPIILGLNLSGHSLGDESILPFISARIREYEIDPGHLCFEITETAAITNMHTASQLIQGLRDMGCHFALDDFGSGMSSFGYLKNLKVDYLKIDGNFVKDILLDPIDWVMVESISKVGQAMGLHVIAEYAESEMIIQRLKELGVDYAQGYGIGRPIPLTDLH